MYKLTYESDEDVAVPGDESKANGEQGTRGDIADSKKVDQFTSYPDYRPNEMEAKESRSDTVASTTKAAFGVDKAKSNPKKSHVKRNFYSLFDSMEPLPTKNNSYQIFKKGCSTFILCLYLFALTAAVIFLFVHLQRLGEKNEALTSQVNFLQASVNSAAANSAAGGESPVVIPAVSIGGMTSEELVHPSKPQSPDGGNEHPPPPPMPDSYEGREEHMAPPPPPPPSNNDQSSCCASVHTSIIELAEKISNNEDSIQQNQISNSARMAAMETDLSSMEARIQLIQEDSTSNSNLEQEMEEQFLDMRSDLNDMVGEIDEQRTIAFSAYRAPDILSTDFHGDTASFEVAAPSPLGRTLFYNYELINRRQDMDSSNGVFTVPYDGVYVFHVSFCTSAENGSPTAVALISGGEPIRIFRSPIVSASSESFILNLRSPPIPLPPRDDRESTNNALQHSYSVVTYLTAGASVELKLTSGAILELEDRNGMETQACTRFSGFRIR